MKFKKTKRLSVNKSTVAHLEGKQLEKVMGGEKPITIDNSEYVQTCALTCKVNCHSETDCYSIFYC